MAQHQRVQFDGEELHRALARGLGREGGTYMDVVRELTNRGVTISPQRYNDVRKGRSWKLDTIELWLRVAGLELRVRDGMLVLDDDAA